jgi:hypothetical protein
MLVPDWLEHGDEAKKHAGDSCFWVYNFPRLAESPSGAALFGRENVLDLQTRA